MTREVLDVHDPVTRRARIRMRSKRPNLAGSAVIMVSCVAAGLLCACAPTDAGPAIADICSDPSATCVLSNGMTLQTDAKPVVLAPIEVTLRDVGTSVETVRVEASMTDMSMPPIGVDLRNSGPSQWSGQLILPVCSQGRTDWVWTLVTRVGSGEQRTRVVVHAVPR